MVKNKIFLSFGILILIVFLMSGVFAWSFRSYINKVRIKIPSYTSAPKISLPKPTQVVNIPKIQSSYQSNIYLNQVKKLWTYTNPVTPPLPVSIPQIPQTNTYGRDGIITSYSRPDSSKPAKSEPKQEPVEGEEEDGGEDNTIPIEYKEKKSATIFENIETSFVSVISLINGNFLIAYQNESPRGSGNFIIYDQNGNLVKSKTQFDPSSTIYHAMANFGNGNVLIAYDEAGSGGAKFVIYDQNGNLVKSKTQFDGYLAVQYISATSLTNGNILIAWADNLYGKFAIIGGEGNFVKTVTSFENATTGGISVSTLTNGNILIAYRDNGDNGKGKFVIYDQNGDLVKSETEFESGNIWVNVLSSSTLTNGNILIAYRDNGDNGKGKFVIYDQNGDLVKSETTFDSNSIGNSLSSSTLTNGNILIAYKDGGWDGNLVIYDQNGDLVKSLTEFNDNNIDYVSVATLINGDFVIGYIHGGLPQVGKFQIWGPE